MSDPLYRKEILRLAADAHGAGRLQRADLAGAAHNLTCGDKVMVELAIGADGRVTAMAHDTKACVLTQASASILGDRLKGARQEDVEALANDVAAMLVSNGDAPAPPFEPYVAFQGAVMHRNRHRCVLLPIEAVLDAFEQEPNQAA
ncbi:MAG TPA: iron-sulfur cluster assembly scaffold protein [Rhizomicrobium sp.]|jgi:NifU-like protein involved in Fe-S cluster formation|nr:iron-sulfur cluster assembly scaffold protein [Rhizomicrobium sp.]